MPIYRVADAARKDIQRVLAESETRWGVEASRRYASFLIAAFRRIAADPEGRSTRDRSEIVNGLRSLHLRHLRQSHPTVKHPAHVVVYRNVDPELVEIVRVLHERMDPSRHFRSET